MTTMSLAQMGQRNGCGRVRNDLIFNSHWDLVRALEPASPASWKTPATSIDLFYHNHGRLPLTNGLLIVSDGEVPEGEKKLTLKISMKCSDIQNHIVSFPFNF